MTAKTEGINLKIDTERLERARREMEEKGIGALWCRIPENVLYLSGYWPAIGASAILFPLDGDPVLMTPIDEIDYAERSWVKDVRTYEFLQLEALPDVNRELSRLLGKAVKEKRLERAVIGY